MEIDTLIQNDVEILKKYETGGIIDIGDLPTLNRLENIGFIKKGIILQGKKCITAKTLPIGLKLIEELG